MSGCSSRLAKQLVKMRNNTCRSMSWEVRSQPIVTVKAGGSRAKHVQCLPLASEPPAMTSPVTPPTFSELALSPAVLKALETTGYERPSPIQAQTIPLLLDGRDVIGQAQTGTGKTAAFALPLLSKLNFTQKEPQVLVLAPTRELAIQVAEAFQTYASAIKGFQVLPVYGGADYRAQIAGLRRGSHVVVGTPGRVMDHMRKGTLDLSKLKTLVLDEADEMLRMGFIDDVQWILEQTPADRQIALFSATMPPQIRKIANQHLTNPAHITIENKTVSADTIRQRFWPVSGTNKLDALTRILEAEDFNAILIFVRTKTLAVELADKLSARGFAASALNGDMSQQLRESTVDKLRHGKLDILVATDVAARGLDVERISHVINYDIPHDVETYVHRIGRTGRAGREGDAILFVAPREQRMLSTIERATRKKISLLELPSTEVINDKRIGKFMQRITDILAQGGLTDETQLVERYQREHNVPAPEIAAALVRLMQGDSPLLLEKKARSDKRGDKYEDRNSRSDSGGEREPAPRKRREERPASSSSEEFAPRPRRARSDEPREAGSEGGREDSRDSREGSRDEGRSRPVREREERAERRPNTPPDLLGPTEEGKERYRIEVGHNDNVKPGNIVGAIANEAGIDSQFIGRINIYDDFSVIDLPEGMPTQVLQHLQKVWVANKPLQMSRFDGGGSSQFKSAKRSDERKSFDKKPFDKTGGEKKFSDRKPSEKSVGDKKFGDKKFGDKKFGDKKFGDKPFGEKKFGDKKPGEKKFGEKKFSDGSKSFGDMKFGDKKFGDKPAGDKKFGDKKFGDKKFSDKKFSGSNMPAGDKKFGDKKTLSKKPSSKKFSD
jgi:ATP-dependent RNA helicase DeaD